MTQARDIALTSLESRASLLPSHRFMQSAVDALKSVMSSSTSGDAQVPKQFEHGFKPDADKGKEAQGGDDSRPPGKQHTMPGECLPPSHSTVFR